MRRHVPLERKTPLRRGKRMGAAAKARVAAGGVLSKGRESATKEEWLAIVAAVRRRAKDRDEIYPGMMGTDPAHILSRSARGYRSGGADATWNVLWLSRHTHRLQDRPYAKGRLVYAFLNWDQSAVPFQAPRQVRWAIEVRDGKGAPLRAVLKEGVIDLRCE